MENCEITEQLTRLNAEISERIQIGRNLHVDVEKMVAERKCRFEKEIVNVPQTAAYLDVTPAAVLRMVQQGLLHPVYEFRKKDMLFLRTEVELQKFDMLSKDKK